MKLFHYTSPNGYAGFVLNKNMRLTQSTQSNDEKDTIHIHNLINENIEDFYINQDIKENKVIEAILRIFNNFEKDWFVEGKDEKSEKAFVMCFTTKVDNRLLWTAYTSDEGYCIGINFEKFEKYIKSSSSEEKIFKIANKFFMSEIIYDKNNQKSLIREIIKEEYNRFSNMKDDMFSTNIPTIIFPYQFVFTDEDNNVIYKGEKKHIQIRIKQKFEFMTKSIIEKLLFVSPILKNYYWEDEGETRLIFYRPVFSENLKSVETDGKNRNFVRFEIIPDIIEEVIIGPKNPKTIDEVHQELVDAGYDINKVKIRYSKGKGVLREKGK